MKSVALLEGTPVVRVRPPRADELAKLSKLCLRSKAVWEYDQAFLDACRRELTLRKEELLTSHIAVAEVRDDVVGIAQVKVDHLEADLLKLFVEPTRLRSGTGRLLFNWACEVAREHGAIRLLIESDPDAAPFYRCMGAADVGFAPSDSIPERMLPVLAYDLSRAPSSAAL